MGEISIHRHYPASPAIVNIYGQHKPGKPTRYGGDSAQDRQQSFASALKHFASYIASRHTDKVTIAIPWKIGCGLAQGHWPTYQKLITNFQTAATCVQRTIHITYYCYTPETTSRWSTCHEVPNSTAISRRSSQKRRPPTQNVANTKNQEQRDASQTNDKHKHKRKRR